MAPNAQLRRLNENVVAAVGDGALAFPQCLTDLKSRKTADHPRLIGGISGFGACGTIVHVVVEESDDDFIGLKLNKLGENPVGYDPQTFPLDLKTYCALSGSAADAVTPPSAAAASAAAASSARKANSPMDLVRSCVGEVLGDEMESELSADEDLTDAGIDSLAAIELRNRLVDVAGTTDLPSNSSLLLAFPSMGALATMLDTVMTTKKKTSTHVSAPAPKTNKKLTTPARVPVDPEYMNDIIALSTKPESDVIAWFVHGIDGGVASVAAVARSLPWTCYGISLSETTKRTCDSLPALASRYAEMAGPSVYAHHI